jgi:hypothetical protein
MLLLPFNNKLYLNIFDFKIKYLYNLARLKQYLQWYEFTVFNMKYRSGQVHIVQCTLYMYDYIKDSVSWKHFWNFQKKLLATLTIDLISVLFHTVLMLCVLSTCAMGNVILEFYSSVKIKISWFKNFVYVFSCIENISCMYRYARYTIATIFVYTRSYLWCTLTTLYSNMTRAVTFMRVSHSHIFENKLKSTKFDRKMTNFKCLNIFYSHITRIN